MAGLGFGLGVTSYPSRNVLSDRNAEIASAKRHDRDSNSDFFTLCV
jgi:hypothetical protein